MVYTCFLCKWRSNKHPQRSYHKFPSNNELKQKWLDILGKSNVSVGTRTTLCSIHFEEDCFRRGLVYERKILKDGSLPTLYLTKDDTRDQIINSTNILPESLVESSLHTQHPTADNVQMKDLVSEWNVEIIEDGPINVLTSKLDRENTPAIVPTEIFLPEGLFRKSSLFDIQPVKPEIMHLKKKVLTLKNSVKFISSSKSQMKSQLKRAVNRYEVEDELMNQPASSSPLQSAPVRPSGPKRMCVPVKVTSGPSPKFEVEIPPDPPLEFNPLITEIKSEPQPIEPEEDPPSEDTLSLGEDSNQLSDADPPSEDADHLSDADPPSEDLIPLSAHHVPLSTAADPLSDVCVKVEEVEVTSPVDEEPVEVKQAIYRASNVLIHIQAQKINNLTIRYRQARRKVNSLVQVVRRRDREISELQGEIDRLQRLLGENQDGKAGLDSVGRSEAPKIQIPSSNNATVKKKSNQQLLIFKRGIESSDNLQKSLVGALSSTDIPQKSLVGALSSTDITQKSLGGVKRTLGNRQKSSVSCQPTPDIQQKSVIQQIGVKHTLDIPKNPSVDVQPMSDAPQTSSVGLQRTSDIRQNALVFQIDGMHSTVLQPKLVRLQDSSMEMG